MGGWKGLVAAVVTAGSSAAMREWRGEEGERQGKRQGHGKGAGGAAGLSLQINFGQTRSCNKWAVGVTLVDTAREVHLGAFNQPFGTVQTSITPTAHLLQPYSFGDHCLLGDSHMRLVYHPLIP